MRKTFYILIPFFIMGSHLIADDCNPDQTFIDMSDIGEGLNECFHTGDLEVLRIFANNSGLETLSDFALIGGNDSLWTGTIIFADTRITAIYCINCSVEGEIPPEIANLTELTELYIMNQPNVVDTIPSAIGSLDNLEKLYLSNNNLEGSIPSAIGSLNNLKQLYLEENNFTDTIPSELGSLASLEYLDLRENNFTGTIPSSIGNLMNLLQLKLSYNNLEGSIPSAISSLNNLKQLYLEGNNLTGTIPSSIGNLMNLLQLKLSSNHLGCKTYDLELDICTEYCNGINGCSGEMPSELGDLTELTELYLNFNELTGTIPTELGSLDNLEKLYLSNNNLTGLIPNSICNLSEDSNINFSGNNLCEPYPDTCDNINTNDQTGCVSCPEDKLPVDGENCYSKLDLDVLILFSTNSNLSTEYTDIISMGEQNWQGGKLTNWICNTCSFTGTIPSSISDLTNLTYLNLSSNNLSGSISDIFNLTNLTYLNLSSNNYLSESISNIINLDKLDSLNLSNNNLSGLIPSAIGTHKLLSLDLSNNNFTGTVPEDICTYYGNESYYNFDSNILCPPYPQCSSTSSDEQKSQLQNSLFIYVPDENNDGNGSIDSSTWCEEEFCADPEPPEGHECYGFIIDADPTDAADSCDPGQERDDCGVCGGTGMTEIYNCCPINNLGFADGTGPNGEVADECGVCGGPNTNCSSDQTAATCPDADEYCGSCFGNNECIPHLVFIEPDIDIEDGSMIDINTGTISFHFSVPVNYLTSGIEIDSYQSLDFLFTVETEPDSIIELTLDDPLISYDDLEITLNPCQIKSLKSNNNLDESYCLDTNTDIDTDIIPEGNQEPPIKIGDLNSGNKELYVSLLGDYNLDEYVDDDDLSILLSVWKTEDFSYELGPWNGNAPFLQPNNIDYDGDYDLHDLMGFVQMWNWDYPNHAGREIQSTPTINYVPKYSFENNHMSLNIENFPGDIKMLSFQLNVNGSDIEIENSVNSSMFDISLHGSYIEHGIYDWVLGSISPNENRSIDLFTIIPSTTIKDVNLQLAYKIVGFDQEISSGDIDFTFKPFPEKITISPPYPNPFNPTTMINYGVPEKSDVLIEIYNLQGRLIEKTIRSNIETGYYTFTWDGSNQSSGIYLIRIKIADTITNYRTLLLK